MKTVEKNESVEKKRRVRMRCGGSTTLTFTGWKKEKEIWEGKVREKQQLER
jgi:hypothetical protein